MHNPEPTIPALRIVGTVWRVDTLNRELTVLVNGEPLTFDVPVDCAIVLHGERVRLRMVQPRDRVRLAFTTRDSLRMAHAIDVQPDQLL